MSVSPNLVLKEFRDFHGWTQTRLGLEVGWSLSTVSRLEKGKQPFKTTHLQALESARLLTPGDRWHRQFLEALEPTDEDEVVIQIRLPKAQVPELLNAIKDALEGLSPDKATEPSAV